MCRRRAVLPLAAIAVVLAAAPARASGLSERIERWLGSYTRSAIEHSIRVDPDPLIQGIVEQTGEGIGRATLRRDLPYRFRVLDVEDVNAISAPGGYIWVTKGTLRYVDSTDELAAILGHEAAHIDHRHGWQAFEQDLAFLAVLLSLPSATPTGVLRWADNAYFLAGLKFSRDDEYEADREGLRLAYEAGYDGAEITAFLDRLMHEPEGDVSRFEALFCTHPRHRDRIDRLCQPAEDEVHRRMSAGEGLLARRCFALARGEFEAALAVDPSNSDARIGASLCAGFLGEADTARAHWLAAAAERSPGLLGEDPALRSARETLDALERAQSLRAAPPADRSEARALAAQLSEAAGRLRPMALAAVARGSQQPAPAPPAPQRVRAAADPSLRAELERVLSDRVALLTDLGEALATTGPLEPRLAHVAEACLAQAPELERLAEAAQGKQWGDWSTLIAVELDNSVWRLSLEASRSPVPPPAVADCIAHALALDSEAMDDALTTTSDPGAATLIAAIARQTGAAPSAVAAAVLTAARPSLGAEAARGRVDNLAVACRFASRTLERERGARTRPAGTEERK